jgi:hypothetical protein
MPPPSGDVTSSAGDRVGGLVGFLSVPGNAAVTNVTATGDVSAGDQYVGGLIGWDPRDEPLQSDDHDDGCARDG